MAIRECDTIHDLIICGGGPSGIAAAIAAGRAGLRVLLIERAGYLGGVSTACALPFWLGGFTGSRPYREMLQDGTPYENLPRPRRAVGGVFKELCDALRDAGAGTGADPFVMGQASRHPGLQRLGCHDEFTFDLEAGKRMLEQKVLEAGAELLFYTAVCGAEAQGGRINAVITASKAGLTRRCAEAFIDCTGDADVAYFAGAPTTASPLGDVSAVSLIAHIENVDARRLEAYLNAGGDPYFREACARARSEHPELDLPETMLIFPMVQPGVFMVNGGTDLTGYDSLDPLDMTRLSVRGRARAENIARHIFRHIPGGESCRVRLTAPWPGVRESRRIVSRGALTEEDLLTGRVFPDSVALAARHFDLDRGRKQPFHEKKLRMKRDAAQIPYNCMVPQGIENLLAAGRCIQADGQALGPARIMATCFAVGQAAGTAAAIRHAERCAFSAVPYPALRRRLLDDGAILD